MTPASAAKEIDARIKELGDWRGELLASARRLIQKAKGIRYTIVKGVVTFEDSACTHATPGKLLRSYDMVNK